MVPASRLASGTFLASADSMALHGLLAPPELCLVALEASWIFWRRIAGSVGACLATLWSLVAVGYQLLVEKG